MDVQVADIFVGLAFELLPGKSQIVVERVKLQTRDLANVTTMVFHVVADDISRQLCFPVASGETRESAQKPNESNENFHFRVSIEPRQF